MRYDVYRLRFLTGVHLGDGSQADGSDTIRADTLFSALCQEAAQTGIIDINDLVKAAAEGKFKISDSFPYIGEELYLPKPLYTIEHEKQGDSVLKKSFKKLKYIPLSLFDVYMKGELNPVDAAEKLKSLGAFSLRTMESMREPASSERDIVSYFIGVYRFNEGCGLYFIAGFEDQSLSEKFEELLKSLSYSGIGGKRSSGLGKFNAEKIKIPEILNKKLEEDASPAMSLSVCMAEDLSQILEGANYLLLKRAGFVSSPDYAPRQTRKRDFYSFCAGSCFKEKFTGGVFDVGGDGAHPVYRYAAPLWMVI